MKQEPCTNEISDELVGVLGRFNAWRTTNGSEADGDNGTASWRLVYGEALESIERLNQLVGDSSSAPLLAQPASTGPFLVVSSGAPRPSLKAAATGPELSRAPRSFDPAFDPDASFSTSFPGSLPAAGPRAAGIRIEEVRMSRAAEAKTSLHRDTSVTVRLTSVEATLLKRKADEAGVTLSAYLRQCATDVERLGNDAAAMQIELERLRRSASAAASQPFINTSNNRSSARRGVKKFAQRALAAR